jgi:hypothetical protein
MLHECEDPVFLQLVQELTQNPTVSTEPTEAPGRPGRLSRNLDA